MDNSEAYYGDDALHVGNCQGLPILHIGSSNVYSPQKIFSLENILHVPEISHNLLFVHKFCHDNDVFFEFHTSYYIVKDESTHTTLLTALSKHGLYTITLPQLNPSSPRLPISSPSSVSHLSPTSQTSPESSNGQPSPISTTSIPTPPPPTPPPPPPPITRQLLANLCQIPKQRVPYNLSANHATVLPTTVTEPTLFTVANNSPEWCQDMRKELKRDNNGAITRYKVRFVAKVTKNWPLDQLDIQNAFLHGNLKEQVCQYIHALTENHWSAVKRILRYLHGTVEHALLNVLGIRSSSTPILWCDNLGATYLSANLIIHACTKHVEIDYHFVREKVAQGDLRVQHISTHDQIVDIFTKPLPTH
ncbi:integrase [Tanacetum coccineum]